MERAQEAVKQRAGRLPILPVISLALGAAVTLVFLFLSIVEPVNPGPALGLLLAPFFLYSIVLVLNAPLIAIGAVGMAVIGLFGNRRARLLSLAAIALWAGMAWAVFYGPFGSVLKAFSQSPL